MVPEASLEETELGRVEGVRRWRVQTIGAGMLEAMAAP